MSTTTHTTGRGRSLRSALALAVAAPVAFGAALVTAAPAQAAGCHRLEVIRLTAHDTEESTDEISIKYLDVNHRVNMSQGNETNPPSRDFCTSSFEVNLWEWDSGRFFDPHDHLGRLTVSTTQAGQEQQKWFTGHGTAYEFVYHVVPL